MHVALLRQFCRRGPLLARRKSAAAMAPTMPISRYLFYVGGALLAMLFVADAFVPIRPAIHDGVARSSTIRIHSDLRLPERIVLDTSRPTIMAVDVPKVELAAPPGADLPQTRAREAFARLGPLDIERPPARPSAKADAKPQRQNKIVRRHIERNIRLVSRPPQYGWFGNQVW
ncbi:hypothetical protein [Bradyrhizobium sp. CSS354]|uniref:hypothetical protein n=1 Tax=Bradyrhizobium sp. CSS354 TaxID=2699172 RepID=UPI0023AED36F|nr:hypothetical protein [Bradyrhizobium sp. CSS354]